MSRKIAIIGSGISGLSAACYAAKAGDEVHVFEKNRTPGGRARQFTTAEGYTFDMGPSWYWMPDIMEQFFADFGHSSSDFYELVGLDPQFEMLFSDGVLSIPKRYEDLISLFETLEVGAGVQLERFMKAAAYKYKIGMQEFVQKPCNTWWEFVSPKIAKSALKLDLLTNFRAYVKKYFKHPKLVAFMEFPVIFLGAAPDKIPALYSLMNYGGYVLGTWYPMGGFFQLILAMKSIAEKLGVTFYFDHPVSEIQLEGDYARHLLINGEQHSFDAIIASADYHHVEKMLPIAMRNYSEAYWEARTFAPSCLIFYIGLNTLIPNIKHHTLFFETDFDEHIDAIYTDKKWPEQPLFYACCPSQTDPSVAPEGHENLFLLMPLATGLADEESIRNKYFEEMVIRLQKHSGLKDLKDHIVYKQSYCVSDFVQDYNAYGGNAYGLANTLSQTAVRKPSIRNKKIKNLFYTGQLTVPGPGVPPSIISGKIAANELHKLKIQSYESIV